MSHGERSVRVRAPVLKHEHFVSHPANHDGPFLSGHPYHLPVRQLVQRVNILPSHT